MHGKQTVQIAAYEPELYNNMGNQNNQISRYNIYLLCKLSGGQRLPLSVIPQIVTGQITCRLFLKRYRYMEQKPTLVKLTQRCVIENTIEKTMSNS